MTSTERHLTLKRETFHDNGTIATRTYHYVRYDNGKARTYELKRFYSSSGVYYNFVDRPAKLRPRDLLGE